MFIRELEHVHGGGVSFPEAVVHALEHTIEDNWFVLVILFITYLAMEWLEHYAGAKIQGFLQKAGKAGPVIGSLVGAVPQCGFSAAASNLYAGRLISVGTLLAIYLSTSDEMLPIMISSQAEPKLVGSILLMKVAIGMAAGFIIDFIHRGKTETHIHIHEMCEEQHCHCEKGIFMSALKHTMQVGLFILLISYGLNLILTMVGDEVLAGFLLNRPVLGPLVAGVVGLVPNCASSVVITELFLNGVISAGTMMAGLLVGAGVGLLVLLRVNHNRKENAKIIATLYVIGALSGIVLELFIRFV